MKKIILADCLDALKDMKSNSVDSIVTDPPYGLSFMGKKWDYDVPSVEIWSECLRVLKHGGHLLSFAGSRTYHRMAVNIEDAGFEIRDQIMWVYGSGFPKSHNISKAIDKAAGAEREIIGEGKWASVGRKHSYGDGNIYGTSVEDRSITAPATPEAKQWYGWGTALKPAHEPIVVARKPLIGTVVENVLEHGTGGLNIDGCRIEYDKESYERNQKASEKESKQHEKAVWKDSGHKERRDVFSPKGRFPANFIHDGSDEVVSLFPDSKSNTRPPTGKGILDPNKGWNNNSMIDKTQRGFKDEGSAARFFYCAKASKAERSAGLENNNIHPTVKPVALMKYLCRLFTPPNGIVLDPFMGSGTTGVAALAQDFSFIGVERDSEYFEIAQKRLSHISEEVERHEEVRRKHEERIDLF